MEYDILGIDRHIGPHELDRVMRHLRGKYHPDRFGRESDDVQELASTMYDLVTRAHTRVLQRMRVDSVITPFIENCASKHL